MRRRSALLGLTLLVFGACVPREVSRERLPTLPSYGFGTRTAMPPSPSASEILATEGPRPTARVVEPEVVRACLAEPQVPFGDLAIDAAYRLILRGVNNAGGPRAFVISGSDPSPLPMPVTDMREGWRLSGFGLSPSGRWLQLDYLSPTRTQYSIWYSSLDGGEQWSVLLLEAGSFTVSVSDEEMIVVGVPEHDQADGYSPLTELAPLAVTNPYTGLSQDLPDLPMGAIFQFYVSYEGERYAVYDSINDPEYGYYLYTYSDGTSAPVFQWLTEAEDAYPTSPATYRGSNGLFGATVSRSYGFDFAIDLTFDEIMEHVSYEQVMQAVVLPGGDAADANTAVYGEAQNGPFAVTRHSRLTMEPNSFYLFDHTNTALTDYCLDAHIPPTAQVSGPVSLSPDHRFLAAVVERLTDDQSPIFEPQDTLVLDILTGRFAILERYLSVGWAIVDE